MLREISLAEVKRHNSEKSDWIVIHNEVYDVTKYLSEHPGGEDVLLEVAGQVATQSFEDIGHSDDARQIMKKYKIGALPANEYSVPNSEAPKVGCGPDDEHNKTRRTFDGVPTNKTKKHPPVAKSTSAPRIERRVNAIVVPRERRPRGRPCNEGTHTNPQPRPRPKPKPKPKPQPESEPEPQTEPEPEPRPRRRSSLPPESGNWWKWALLALAGAITVGLIVKKKMGT